MQQAQKYYFEWLNDLSRMMFPKNCCSCGINLNKNEEIICISCLTKLPRTNYHRLKPSPIQKRFDGRIPVEQATSFLSFRRGNQAQILLHELKYRGRQDIGEYLGEIFGADLARDGFTPPDVIIPLPLHPAKLAIRGYNQCHSISRGMKRFLGGELAMNAVRRKVHNETQTSKTRFERWMNVEHIFEVTEPGKVLARHVLIIDDVVTTGATLEACGRKLLESGARSLSLATLASA